MSKVTVVIQHGRGDIGRAAKPFTGSSLVGRIIVLAPPGSRPDPGRVQLVQPEEPDGGPALRKALDAAPSDHVLFVDGGVEVRLGQFALERLVDVADQTGAGMVYADYLVESDAGAAAHPLIDYQLGSIRDDFAFGPMRLVSRKAVRRAFEAFGPPADVKWSAHYDLRLKISVAHAITHLPEPLYAVVEPGTGEPGDEHFAYVDPANANVQKEMEAVATEHLRRIGAYLPPEFEPVPEPDEGFEVQASVVMPVRNREGTIADAVASATSQSTSFAYNVIIVDNHSTDRTSEIVRDLARRDRRIVHIIPSRTDLGIGGCWNEAIGSPRCGRLAVQLDSDDLYADSGALEQMVTEFERGPYAMVIGSYRVVDSELSELPPGVVDHREWTRENGRNNVLRVNGFGAPRAFHTSLLRRHRFPNVSYGEDYAVGLRLSRTYEVGRIFEPVYLCRRWEGNTDAALPVTKANQYNLYKDRLRTIEILARQQMNRGGRQLRG